MTDESYDFDNVVCDELHPDGERRCILPLGHGLIHQDHEIEWAWTGFWEAPVKPVHTYV